MSNLLNLFHIYSADDDSPWNDITIAEEINAAPGNLHVRIWGSGSDAAGLGLYNGYINATTNAIASFPWTSTLSEGLIFYTPRLDYDEDDWWTRWDFSDNTGSMSITSGSFGTFTQNGAVTVTMAGAANDEATITVDWSTDGTVGGIVNTITFKMVMDL